MMSTLEQLNKGCTIQSHKNKSHEKIIIGFVDDKRKYTIDWIDNYFLTGSNNLQDAT